MPHLVILLSRNHFCGFDRLIYGIGKGMAKSCEALFGILRKFSDFFGHEKRNPLDMGVSGESLSKNFFTLLFCAAPQTSPRTL